MTETIPYQLEIEDESLTVRFDRNFFDNNDVQEMLEFLRLKIVRKRAQLRDEEVAALADEVNQQGWERIRDSFLRDVNRS
jgi:hypothetical protein